MPCVATCATHGQDAAQIRARIGMPLASPGPKHLFSAVGCARRGVSSRRLPVHVKLARQPLSHKSWRLRILPPALPVPMNRPCGGTACGCQRDRSPVNFDAPDAARAPRVVPRIVWFEPPERALADPVRFMAYGLTGTPRWAAIRRHRCQNGISAMTRCQQLECTLNRTAISNDLSAPS
jgi:hypothetical protein